MKKVESLVLMLICLLGLAMSLKTLNGNLNQVERINDIELEEGHHTDTSTEQLIAYKNFIKYKLMTNNNPRSRSRAHSFLSLIINPRSVATNPNRTTTNPRSSTSSGTSGTNTGSSSGTSTTTLSSAPGEGSTAPRMEGLSSFFPGGFYDRLNFFPLTGKSKTKPWSGYYFAYTYLALALRYPNNIKNTMFQIGPSGNIVKWYTYSEAAAMYSQPSEFNSFGGNTANVEYALDYYMSVAEKIDVVFNDSNFSFTNKMKRLGEQFMVNGDVASWIGFCHGWAPASYFEPRAKRSVTLTAADNKTRVKFYPDDIEAMATIFWGQASFNTLFVGNRCTEVSTCKNVLSPGVFLTIIANQIGLKQLNVIFEPEIDTQIWNYPIFEYIIKFYHPHYAGQHTDHLESALMRTSEAQYSNDPVLRSMYASRTSYTAYFIGVWIQVTYTEEDYPYHGEQIWDDTVGSDTYVCILELTQNYQIIGGRWAQPRVPTFIWTPENKESAEGPYDQFVPYFNGTVEELKNIRTAAIYSSQYGTVLKAFMEYLTNESNKE